MVTSSEASAGELAAFAGAGGWATCLRDCVVVTGRDAKVFLQGQLSQDVDLLNGEPALLSFLLSPDGKAEAMVRISATEEGFLLDCEVGSGQAVAARLDRFRIRTAVEMELRSRSFCSLRSFGVGLGAPAQEVAWDGAALPALWPWADGWDLPAGSTPAAEAIGQRSGLPACSPGSLEVLRVIAGMPANGPEINGSVLPAETGMLRAAVSFGKGCYTGQELVERMASRGARAPRRLCHLLVARPGRELTSDPGQGSDPVPGERLWSGDKEVGRVTSCAVLDLPTGPTLPDLLAGVGPGRHGLGLAYLHRSIDVGAPLTVGPSPGGRRAVAHRLPGDADASSRP